MTFPERFSEVVVDFPRKKILSDCNGTYSADEVYRTAQFVASEILNYQSYKGERICLLAPAGLAYVAGMLGGMMSGAMVVPLCVEHPTAELDYIISDCGAKIILAHPDFFHLIENSSCAKKKLTFTKPPSEPIAYNWDYPKKSANALLLYTSGTTGKPKGVVHTHASLYAQITCLIEAWGWNENDSILHFLPLHHTHGIINKLFCSLSSGAHCYMIEKFDSQTVWDKMLAHKFSVFMAVPTIYSKMILFWDSSSDDLKSKYSSACASFRLMVSGSSALPVSVFQRWEIISGHILLERYGMTETGMILSNSLLGVRIPGSVGKPLPGVEVRFNIDEATTDAMAELEVRGLAVFKEYWNKQTETKKSFTTDGWFKTGDIVSIEADNYKIMGRIATDIIKSGGYKISSLEIETVLLTHKSISECCVLGIQDDVFGERVAVLVVLTSHNKLNLDELRDWAKDKLANYKLPTIFKITDSLPRNSMGKVVKSELRAIYFT